MDVRAGVLASIAFAGALLSAGYVCPANTATQRVLGLLALLPWIMSGFSTTRPDRPHLGSLALSLLATVSFVALPDGALYAYAMALYCGARLSLRACAVPILGAAVVSELWPCIPYAGGASRYVSSAIAHVCAGSTLPEYVFGETAIGLPIVGLSLVYLWALARKRSTKVIGSVAILFVTGIQRLAGHWWFQNLGEHAGHGHKTPVLESLWWLCAGCVCIVAISLSGGVRPLRVVTSRSRRLEIVASIVIGSLYYGLIVDPGIKGRANREILFADHEGLDWGVPRWGDFGVYAGGMFGLLPEYCKSFGWKVDRIQEADLVSDLAHRAGIVVIINSPRTWTCSEVDSIERFVERGNSLLVLGDHTDVFGLMKGLNTLTERFGIRYNFDSAYHLGSGWKGKMHWNTRAGFASGDPAAIGIGIGASLQVSYPAEATLEGRYAFSDHGDSSNIVGSFLGNYALDEGEKVGDIVVAAQARRGRGTVCVFGDTSTVQNGTLSGTYEAFVEPLLNDLASPSVLPVQSWARVCIATALLLAALFAIWLSDIRVPVCSAAAAATVAILCCAKWGCAPASNDSAAPRARAVIDLTYAPSIGHYRAGWNAVWPLEAALQRQGMLVFRSCSLSRSDHHTLGVIAIIEPRARISPRDCDELMRCVKDGTHLIVACSAEAWTNVSVLSELLGVYRATGNLGPVPRSGRNTAVGPRFVSPCGVALRTPEHWEVLYSYNGSILVATQKVGDGKVTLVADGRYFSSENLEGEWGWHPANLMFVKDMLEVAEAAVRVSTP